MLCENCGKNPATTHIKTVINGVVTEKNLCGYCAAMSGYSKFVNNGFASMLSAMFSDELATGNIKEHRCECCGTRFSDIAESGKMGCSECYESFKNKLIPYLKRVHGTTEHIGKRLNVTSSALAPVTKEDKKETLRAQMLKAVREENFELAAKLRDEIKELEGREDNE